MGRFRLDRVCTKHVVYAVMSLTFYPLWGSKDVSGIRALTFYQNDLHKRKITNMAGVKPIAI
jgi:hypothetical protein